LDQIGGKKRVLGSILVPKKCNKCVDPNPT